MTMFTSSQATVSANGPKEPDYETMPITPSDTVDVPTGGGNGKLPRALQCTGAGNVSVNLFGGGTAVLTGLAAGQRILLSFTRVLATGTTATGILAEF